MPAPTLVLLLGLVPTQVPPGKGASALDRLEAAAIPPIERFAWQPKELVAVMGSHRGNQSLALRYQSAPNTATDPLSET